MPPDINRSRARFSIEVDENGKQSIRYALAAVKKVGEAAMESLVATRGDKPFASLAEFAARIDPKSVNKMQLENLARAGAFDGIDKRRGRIFATAETIIRRAQAAAEESNSGQIGLFGGGGKPEELRLADVPEWPDLERLGYEAEAVGFHLTSHPLEAYGPLLKRLGVIPSSQMQTRAEAGGGRVKLAGTVINAKVRPTRTGGKMAWVRLSDQGGSYEVTMFSEVLNRAQDCLEAGSSVLVTADLKLEGESLRVTAHDAISLEAAAAQAGAGLRVWLEESAAVPHIRNLLEREKGRGRVTLVPRVEDQREIEIALPGGYNVTPRLAQAIKLLQGVTRIEES